MAWDDGEKNNPWRSDKDKGPVDLDAMIRDLQRKLAGLFRGARGNGPRGSGPGEQPLGSGFFASAAVLVVAIWALTGTYVVDEAQRGVVLRFGAFQEITQPGLRWHLPWPIESVERININATEQLAYSGSMLTRDENIVNVDLRVQFRRTDPRKFLFDMRDPENTLLDVTASAIREVVGRNVLDFILTEGRTEIARQTQELLQATLDSYGAGITVYEVNLQDANFPREVESSVQDSIKAREDRERRILEAQSYSNEILPRARGEAAARREGAEAYRAQVVANAEGESDRFSQILTQYQKSPAVTRERMYLETLESVLASSAKVLVDTKSNNSLLYLPLEQLLQRRSAPERIETSPGVTAVAPAPNVAPRSRERETR
ncbi:MAG TPA: FtsH protease activity modulator HflK [Gammaproteobacteria bacterium]|jgi:membrane protease subunit HflK|nr:FtsH protease activity modulator HflK [Gammaproteobacteria bacterium]